MKEMINSKQQIAIYQVHFSSGGNKQGQWEPTNIWLPAQKTRHSMWLYFKLDANDVTFNSHNEKEQYILHTITDGYTFQFPFLYR